MKQEDTNCDKKTEKSCPVSKFMNENGSYVVGYLAAAFALIAAFFLPASRESLVGGAGTLAVLTMFFGGGREYGRMLVAMLVAGACLVAAYFMPDQANNLIGASGTIAVLSFFFA